MPHLRTGKVKYIGAMTEKRLASVPDTPTFQEKGFKVFSASAWGLSVPKGTPADIVKRLEEVLLQTTKDPDFLKKSKDLEMPLHVLDGKAYAEYLTEYRCRLSSPLGEGPLDKVIKPSKRLPQAAQE